jgi:multisubunit Na+/H+ antiporter MnhF subunit
VPFILGIIFIIAFFIWEIRFAKYPMAPPKLFSLDKRTMIIILIITFVSGGNYFVLLMMWPSEIYNVYGKPRSHPRAFGHH